MSTPFLSIIILAAGSSERLGQPKQLVKLDNKTLIRRAIETAEALHAGEVIVITGANAEAVADQAVNTPTRCVYNPEWANGMGSSIATGARHVSPEANGILVMLCDQWRVQAQDLQALLDIWLPDPHQLVCSRSQVHQGPPVIFPRSCFDALRNLQGDQGAKSVLNNCSAQIQSVWSENAAIDLDTPSQLKILNKENSRSNQAD